MADPTKVGIVLSVDGASEMVDQMQKVSNEAIELTRVIRALQENSNRDFNQDYALKFLENLGLVNKSVAEVEARLKEIGPISDEELSKVALRAKAAGVAHEELADKAKESTEAHKAGAEHTEHASHAFNELLEAVGKFTGGAFAIHEFWKEAVEGAADFSTALARLEGQAELAGVSQEGLRDKVGETANEFGESLTATTKLYGEALAGGAKDAADAAERVDAAYKLSVISGKDASQALGLIIPVMQQYKEGAGSAKEVSETLASTMANARVPISLLQRGMQQAGESGAALGVSFKETTGAVVSLVQEAGVPPRRAFSELVQIENLLAQKTGDVATLFKNLGYTSGQNAVQVLGFGGALKILASAGGETGDAINKITGNVRLFHAISVLAGKDGAAGLEGGIAKVGQGAEKASEVFEKVDKSLEERLSDLRDNLKNTFTLIGGSIEPALKTFAGALNTIVQAIGNFAKEHPTITALLVSLGAYATLSVTFLALTSALGGTSKAFEIFKDAVKAPLEFTKLIGERFLDLIGLTGKFSVVLQGLFSNAVVLGILAVVAALGLLYLAYERNEEKQKEILKTQQEVMVTHARVNRAGGEIEIQGPAALSNASSENIEEYKHRIQLQLDAAEADQKEAIAQGNKQEQVAETAKKINAYKEALEDATEAQRIATSVEALANGHGSRTRERYEYTQQAVDKLYAAQKQLAQADFTQASANLKDREEVQLRDVDKEKIGKRADIEKGFAAERVKLAEDNFQRTNELDIAATNRTKQLLELTNKNKIVNNETAAAQIRQIDTKLTEDQIKNLGTLQKAIETERGKAVTSYHQYADRVKSLDKEILDLKHDAEYAGNDQARVNLTGARLIEDQKSEYAKRGAEIRQAVANKDFETARTLLKRQDELGKQIGQETGELAKSQINKPEPVPELKLREGASAGLNKYLTDQHQGAVRKQQEEAAYAERVAKEVASKADLEAKQESDRQHIAVAQAERAENQRLAADQKSQIGSLDTALNDIQTKMKSLQFNQIKLIDDENAHQSIELLGRSLKELEAKPIQLTLDMSKVKEQVKSIENSNVLIRLGGDKKPTSDETIAKAAAEAAKPENNPNNNFPDEYGRIAPYVPPPAETSGKESFTSSTPYTATPRGLSEETLTRVRQIRDGTFATGGFVPGSGVGDTVHAMLTPGEHVTNAAAVRYYGGGFMSAINSMSLPRYNLGGMVSRVGTTIQHFAGGGLVSQPVTTNPSYQPVNLHFPFGSYRLDGAPDTISAMRSAVQVAASRRRV